ncbi:hypothetical protein BDZ45DRAFT_803471 [Acephala macrosclerotiorum]|nr:hypothetical protein BDZ45DRAFT_803471 [Acephala macrosclerotiorum]
MASAHSVTIDSLVHFRKAPGIFCSSFIPVSTFWDSSSQIKHNPSFIPPDTPPTLLSVFAVNIFSTVNLHTITTYLSTAASIFRSRYYHCQVLYHRPMYVADIRRYNQVSGSPVGSGILLHTSGHDHAPKISHERTFWKTKDALGRRLFMAERKDASGTVDYGDDDTTREEREGSRQLYYTRTSV